MNRRGVALLMALVALLLVTALATLALSAARYRWLSGSRQLAARLTLEAAQGAVQQHVAQWDSAAAAGLMAGGITALASADRPSSLVSHDSLLRLGASLYLVRSVVQASADDGSILARAGVAGLVVILVPAVGEDSAVTAARRRQLLASSRDNVAILPPIGFVSRGWVRWP